MFEEQGCGVRRHSGGLWRGPLGPARRQQPARLGQCLDPERRRLDLAHALDHAGQRGGGDGAHLGLGVRQAAHDSALRGVGGRGVMRESRDRSAGSRRGGWLQYLQETRPNSGVSERNNDRQLFLLVSCPFAFY